MLLQPNKPLKVLCNLPLRSFELAKVLCICCQDQEFAQEVGKNYGFAFKYVIKSGKEFVQEIGKNYGFVFKRVIKSGNRSLFRR